MFRKDMERKRMWVVSIGIALLIACAPGCSGIGGGSGADVVKATEFGSAFETFKNADEFKIYIKTVSDEKNKKNEVATGSVGADSPMESPTSACKGSCGSSVPGGVETNNQSEGVDEGDIIKFAGDRLVILRDQHLLVLDISDDRKDNPVLLSDTELDADFGAGYWGKGAWYDEMLIFGSKVVLIAFRYGAKIDTGDALKTEYGAAIELLSFDISKYGTLSQEKRIFIESNDYYSGATNYATRKIDNRLIVYSPFYAANYNYVGSNVTVEEKIPHILELIDAKQKLFRRMGPSIEYNKIYKGSRPSAGMVLHTIYTFDPEKNLEEFNSSGVMGDYSQIYYVTDKNLYLNIQNWWVDNIDVSVYKSRSQLFQFDISNTVELKGIAEIEGNIPERFAMLEDGSNLNIITTKYEQGLVQLRAISLGIDKFEVGADAYLPVEYNLSAVRFNGKFAILSLYTGASKEALYLADFQNDVPRITATSINKSNVMLMQPSGENRWLTLADKVEYRDGKYNTGIELGILEVSPLGELGGVADFTIKGDGAWSEAFGNDHAFFFDPERELIGFPYSVWNSGVDYWSGRWQDGVVFFSVTNNGITRLGDGIVATGESCQECWYGNSRTVRSGDSFYNLLGRQLKVSKISADNLLMSEVTNLELFSGLGAL